MGGRGIKDNITPTQSITSHADVPNEGGDVGMDSSSRMSPAASDLVRRLLSGRNNRLGRGGVQELQRHSFFAGVDWDHIASSRPPHTPVVLGDADVTNYDVDDDDEGIHVHSYVVVHTLLHVAKAVLRMGIFFFFI